MTAKTTSASDLKKLPPWGSKERVNRAGDALRDNNISADDSLVLEVWRGAHRYILNTFNVLLRHRTSKLDIIVAQRLKRRLTIVDKLFREPKMRLSRMDDVAGCRLIFSNVNDLREFRTEFHGSKFKHKKKNHIDRYDYIQLPKPSGYRGVHDIYEYNVNSVVGNPYNGLLLELQYRTSCQHAWATAVEVVSRITENQPKFNKGDNRHIDFFRLASEIIARTQEDCNSCYSKLSDKELCEAFKDVDSDINLLRILRGLHSINDSVTNSKNVILQLSKGYILTIHSYSRVSTAMQMYF
jgi:putative GTP pyrophosphokinase